jgi:hypothetical protein
MTGSIDKLAMTKGDRIFICFPELDIFNAHSNRRASASPLACVCYVIDIHAGALVFGLEKNTNGIAKGPNRQPITTQNGTLAFLFLATE